jgi:hypothetical protein
MTQYWVIAPYEANLPAFEKVWQFDLTQGTSLAGSTGQMLALLIF